jgi:hypothetical protein|tara:strand:+ start:38 stop:832 length:795 start_codon:yes stop_codon:yes gene_type:complete
MKKQQQINTVYIGYDEREDTAYEVLKFSIERTASKPIQVRPLKKDTLKRMNMYTRESEIIKGQPYDTIDGRPFSTDFSFSRFLVPALNMYQGKALYMDCDMYVRSDISELFDICDMDYYPLWCVHHKYEPENKIKMDGKEQHAYPRKNWSSLMMFNCGHDLNQHLTPDVVNTQTGRYLHNFGWLPDKEGDIGQIPEEWNWLDGHSDPELKAKNVHFTTGGPWFERWKPRVSHRADGDYAIEWCNEAKWLQMNGLLKQDKDYMIK